jgi:murein DD-endopeptidase MepM/ murein hydrolase activator NlpD
MRFKKRFRIWSLIILSDANKPIKRIRFPKFLFTATINSIIAVITILSLAFVYFQNENEKLANANTLLTKKVEEKDSIIVTLRSEQSFLQDHAITVEEQLNQLKDLEVKIRTISQSLNPKDNYFGETDEPIGGRDLLAPVFSSTHDSYQFNKDYDLFETTQTASDKYESITLQLPKLINQYEQTITTIEKLKIELQYTPTIWPTNVFRVTSTYGYRTHPITRQHALHTGIDIAGPWGSPIYAAADGVITSSGWEGSYGYSVVIKHSSEYETRYGHLSRYIVRSGDIVKKGDTIGYMGTSGRSTGVHLHYEVIRNGQSVNPDPYLTFIIQ